MKYSEQVQTLRLYLAERTQLFDRVHHIFKRALCFIRDEEHPAYQVVFACEQTTAFQWRTGLYVTAHGFDLTLRQHQGIQCRKMAAIHRAPRITPGSMMDLRKGTSS